MAEEGHEPVVMEEDQPHTLDIGWKHGFLIDPVSKRVQCNYCAKQMNGGVYRLKQQIAGIGGNVAKCKQCPRAIREVEEIQEMDKRDIHMKDNKQDMDGHVGSQTTVQDLLMYLHFNLPLYHTQILVALPLEYKKDGDLGMHKNKSIVKLQAHTNHLAFGVLLHHNLGKAQVKQINNIHQGGFKGECMIWQIASLVLARSHLVLDGNNRLQEFDIIVWSCCLKLAASLCQNCQEPWIMIGGVSWRYIAQDQDISCCI